MLRALVLPMILVAALPLVGQTGGSGQRRGGTQGQGQSQNESQVQQNNSQSPSIGTAEPFELTGRVINARTGTAIARALVKLGQRAVLSNHDGVFSFPQVTATTGTLVPSKQGFYSDPSGSVSNHRTLTFVPGTPVDLILYPEAVIAGTVANITGEGLSNFTVTIRKSTFDEYGHHWLQADAVRTDSSGMYRLVVPAGDYVVQARTFGRVRGGAEIYLPVSVPADSNSIADALHVKMGDQLQVNLRPESRKAYVVSITGETFAGRGSPRMVAYSAGGMAIPLSPVPERDGDQTVLRVMLPNGRYRLESTVQSRDGATEAEAQVTVAGRDAGPVVLNYEPAPRLPVEVTVDSGVPAENVTPPTTRSLGLMLASKATNGDGMEQAYPVTSGQDKVDGFAVPHGSYQLQVRSTGPWYVTSADYGGSNLLTENLVTGPGAGGRAIRVQISNQTTSIEGTVAVGGEPGQAFVYLVATMPSARPVVILRASKDGTFSSQSLQPGGYRVLALQQRLTLDPRDPATLTRFLGKVQTVTLEAGGKQTLTLQAVPSTEMPQ